MNICTFRILLEHEEEIFRDIQIRETQNFYEFHEIVIASFGFDNSQMASFYLSDEDWNKGQEITLFDMGMDNESGTPPLVMEEVQLKSILTEIGQHFLYSYDFLNMKNFFLELLEVSEEEKGAFYPRVIYSQGEVSSEKIVEKSKDVEKSKMSDDELADQLLKEAGFGDDFNDEFSSQTDNIDDLDI